MSKLHTHRGYLHQRVQSNPLEAAFAQQWEDRNSDGSLIHAICGDVESFTRQECYIAASIVQWLGTNVGMGFVETALQRCGHTINWFRNGYENEKLLEAMRVAQASKDAEQFTFDLAEPS